MDDQRRGNRQGYVLYMHHMPTRLRQNPPQPERVQDQPQGHPQVQLRLRPTGRPSRCRVCGFHPQVPTRQNARSIASRFGRRAQKY